MFSVITNPTYWCFSVEYWEVNKKEKMKLWLLLISKILDKI